MGAWGAGGVGGGEQYYKTFQIYNVWKVDSFQSKLVLSVMASQIHRLGQTH